MSRPRVSIVIPAFNVEAYIAECLESVLRQTYSDYEAIVVDDGSTDRTAEVALAYGNFARVLRQTNRGLSATRNAGILASHGELVAFLDADDVWLPEYLEQQVETYDVNGTNCLVFSDAYSWDGRKPPAGLELRTSIPFDVADPLLSIVRGSDLIPSGVLVPREILVKAGLFDERLSKGEDHDLWGRLAREGVRFCHSPTALALYRYRPGSLSDSGRRESTENHIRSLSKIARDKSLSPLVRRAARVHAGGMHRRFSWLAIQALLQGEFDEARACWLSAYRICPWNCSYALGAYLVTVAPRTMLGAALRLQQLRLAIRRTRGARP